MRPTPISRLAAALIIAACAGLSSSLVSPAHGADPGSAYLGMTKAEIVACAGEPYARYKSGAEAETLTYHYSGAGPVPGTRIMIGEGLRLGPALVARVRLPGAGDDLGLGHAEIGACGVGAMSGRDEA